MVERALIQIAGPHLGLLYPLKKKRITIGRGHDCDIILNVDSVSRLHCILTFEEGGLVLKDGGSCGGSYVNEQIAHDVALNSSDTIALGSARLKLLEMSPCEDALHLGPSKEAYVQRHLRSRIQCFVRALVEQQHPFGLIRLQLGELFLGGGEKQNVVMHRAFERILSAVRASLKGHEVEIGTLAQFELAVLVQVDGADSFGALCERIERSLVEMEIPGGAWGLGFSMGQSMDAPSDLLARAEPTV